MFARHILSPLAPAFIIMLALAACGGGGGGGGPSGGNGNGNGGPDPDVRAINLGTLGVARGFICDDGIRVAQESHCAGARDVICNLGLELASTDPRCINENPCFRMSDDVRGELAGLCGAVRFSNLRAAYERESSPGITLSGRGITVGVIDDALRLDHPEFNPAGTTSVIGNDGTTTLTLPIGNSQTRTIEADNTPEVAFTLNGEDYTFEVLPATPFGHGTSTTALVGAPKDGVVRPFNMHGIAYNSDIIFRGMSLRFAAPEGTITRLPERFRNPDATRNLVGAEVLKDFVEQGAQIVSSSISFFPSDVPSGSPRDTNRVSLSPWSRETVHRHLGAIACAMAQGMPIPQGAPAAPAGTACPVAATPPVNPTIFASAAGNGGQDNPYVDAGLALLYPELRTHLVAVVNVDVVTANFGHLAGDSNKCGVVADWCIAAPGGNYVTPTEGGGVRQDAYWVDEDGLGYTEFGGTSGATPVVAGALALIFEALGNQLTSVEILQRLYMSANKEGIYSRAPEIEEQYTEGGTEGDTDMVTNPNAGGIIYGQGLLDIGAAVAPIGDGSIRTSLGRGLTAVRDAARFEIGESRISLGPAFGDALSRALDGRYTVFFDELDAAFAFPAADILAPRIHTPGRIRGASTDITSFTGAEMALSFSLGFDAPPQTGTRTGDDYFNLVREGPSLSMRMDISDTQSLHASIFTGRAPETQSFTSETPEDTYGAHIAYGLSGTRYRLSLEAGVLVESDQILGAYPQGAFGHAGETQTVFAGLAGVYALAPNWEGAFHARIGRTTPDALSATQTGLHDITPLTSSAFSAGVYRHNLFAAGDALGFVVAQPLRIEDGSAELTYALGRTRDKELLEETLNIPLAPSGRALAFEATYNWKTLSLSTGYTFAPGHDANAKGAAHIALRLSRAF